MMITKMMCIFCWEVMCYALWALDKKAILISFELGWALETFGIVSIT